jgi:hypothetical protein
MERQHGPRPDTVTTSCCGLGRAAADAASLDEGTVEEVNIIDPIRWFVREI